MAVAKRHQPLADVAAGGYVHAQAARGVLVHEAPIGAHQRPPLGFRERGKIAHGAVAQAIMDFAGVRGEQAGDQIEQRRLARAGFADDRQRLALLDLERYVTAGFNRAVALAEALGGEQGGAHSAASFRSASCRFSQ